MLPRLSISLNRCLAIKTKLPKLALQILRYLREHPAAQDTMEGIMVWWVSERAIKNWLPQVRRSLAALVARGYLEKRKIGDGRVFYRLNPSRPTRRDSSRK
jgi:Fe2+ or Zn2+ uptake regulation protein